MLADGDKCAHTEPMLSEEPAGTLEAVLLAARHGHAAEGSGGRFRNSKHSSGCQVLAAFLRRQEAGELP